MGEVVRISSIIIFYLSKLWKAKFFILCDVIFLVKLEKFWNWSLLGVEGFLNIKNFQTSSQAFSQTSAPVSRSGSEVNRALFESSPRIMGGHAMWLDHPPPSKATWILFRFLVALVAVAVLVILCATLLKIMTGPLWEEFHSERVDVWKPSIPIYRRRQRENMPSYSVFCLFKSISLSTPVLLRTFSPPSEPNCPELLRVPKTTRETKPTRSNAFHISTCAFCRSHYFAGTLASRVHGPAHALSKRSL